ncbi:polyribonucleotide nucleotidyltransferase [Rickettsiales endosymbiont of Peranema trichophorum]|uniref:polyribonucleotide nucleotidyltransferase n=1 Tax=Rickettsiales endosymbiont of Peranema trichophorum TaxID=2486577 RepID=UPI0010230EB9|nr:polyribonucleotide nucleotidyltransferase [Rickettsiales endosymbiont of Peranema trichophorum]RZI46317.1 polyribonucleotide nucleotidyltransferase [Rickettsiales endosymbiont of Peranema trichophorum]
MFKICTKSIDWAGKVLKLETGKIARQSTAAVEVSMGDTVVLCTVVVDKEPKDGIDFFPLTVNYQERFYAAGKIPGGFNKRESKPSEHEVLTSRVIDRPIRPLFPDGFTNEVQVICTVLSYDKDHNADILAMIGASAALTISGVPFLGPIAGARVGYKNGQYMLNPSPVDLEESQLELLVAGTIDSILMVESSAKELSEDLMLEAVMFGHQHFVPVIEMIKEFAKEVHVEGHAFQLFDNTEATELVEKLVKEELGHAITDTNKAKRQEKIKSLRTKAVEQLAAEHSISEVSSKKAFHDLEKKMVRHHVVSKGKRLDGREASEIRDITSEVAILPKVHGSALFTRGNTQALCVLTLGSVDDEQMVDNIKGLSSDRFMLHYNFPPYSVGEIGILRAPGRREIGHGKLALRAISGVLPTKEVFPYTIRVVSEITESYGSSSMATVCGTSLALMDGGVPISAPVAGIAMGLIKEGEKFYILSDITGSEDHLGDMDFKVAGTSAGVTALQMDIKITGVDRDMIKQALYQAKDGRIHILSKMCAVLESPRQELNPNAPRLITIKINKEQIRDVIGAGGKVIRDICEKSNTKINIDDDGTVNIACITEEEGAIALSMIQNITTVPKAGEFYEGIVIKLMEFGAIVKFLGSQEGFLHISELSSERVETISDVLTEGQAVKVQILSVEGNRIKLTLREDGGKRNYIPQKHKEGRFERRGDRADRSDRGDSGNRFRNSKYKERGPRMDDNQRSDSRSDSRRENRDEKEPRDGFRKKKRFF